MLSDTRTTLRFTCISPLPSSTHIPHRSFYLPCADPLSAHGFFKSSHLRFGEVRYSGSPPGIPRIIQLIHQKKRQVKIYNRISKYRADFSGFIVPKPEKTAFFRIPFIIYTFKASECILILCRCCDKITLHYNRKECFNYAFFA